MLTLAELLITGALSFTGVTVMVKLPAVVVPLPSSTLKAKLSELVSLPL